jgi:hypothetical protein
LGIRGAIPPLPHTSPLYLYYIYTDLNKICIVDIQKTILLLLFSDYQEEYLHIC